MNTLGFIIRLMLLIAALWVGGFMAYAARVLDHPPTPGVSDGIVVLTGSSGRIIAGLDLLKQRPDNKMLITGVAPGAKQEALSAAFGIDAKQFQCCIELDRRAEDTVGNAEQTALWVKRNGLKSLVVVTAASHMPRSLVEMRRRMKTIELMPLPTRAGDDDPSRWSKELSALRRFIVEYNKYLFSLVRARVLDDVGDMSRP